jgi:hypothetical protein
MNMKRQKVNVLTPIKLFQLMWQLPYILGNMKMHSYSRE